MKYISDWELHVNLKGTMYTINSHYERGTSKKEVQKNLLIQNVDNANLSMCSLVKSQYTFHVVSH